MYPNTGCLSFFSHFRSILQTAIQTSSAASVEYGLILFFENYVSQFSCTTISCGISFPSACSVVHSVAQSVAEVLTLNTIPNATAGVAISVRLTHCSGVGSWLAIPKLWKVRSRLYYIYWSRSLQKKNRFAACFEIYKSGTRLHCFKFKRCGLSLHFAVVRWNVRK